MKMNASETNILLVHDDQVALKATELDARCRIDEQ